MLLPNTPEIRGGGGGRNGALPFDGIAVPGNGASLCQSSR